MARDIPYVGVTFSPQLKPNTGWYLRSVIKSDIGTPGGTVPTSLFSNITNRTYGFSTRRGSTYELGRIESGECQLSVNNSDGAFDPTNSSGTYYPNLKPYKPLRINCAYPITGNILNNDNLATPTPTFAPVTYADKKVSVGVNDGNFELGAISNWYASPTATMAISTVTPYAGTYKAIITAPDPSAYAYLDVPVVAGKQITISFYYKATAGGKLNIYDGGWGGLSDGKLPTDTATLSTTASWTRLTKTFTPNSPKITIGIGFIGAPTVIDLDNVQVEFGATASAYTTAGSKIYNLFNGFIERYPQTYQAPNRGQTNLFATDSIASISQNDLVSPYESLILQDKALYYYPLSDPADSLIAVNKSAYTQDSMVRQTQGSVTPIIFGDTNAEQGLPNVRTTNVQLDNTYQFPTSKPGTFLTLGNVENVDLRNGKTYTFGFWFQRSNTANQIKFFAHAATAWNPNQLGLEISISNALLEPTFYDSTGSTGSDIQNITNPTEWQFVAVELSYDSTVNEYSMLTKSKDYPDGGGVVVFTTTPSYIPIQSFSLMAWDYDPTFSKSFKRVAHFSVHEGTIDYAAYVEAGQGLFGNTTGTRFKKMVNEYSGMNYLPYSAELGQSEMQYVNSYGTSLGDYVQSISDTEGGYWFVDGEGFVNFKSRWNRLQKLSPSVVFGDDPDSGEIPYAGGDLVINYDPTYVLNDVSITRNNGITAYIQDTDSVADYFPRSYSRTTDNVSDSQTVDMANYLLSRYKQPNARPEVLTFTPARNPSIWPTILDLEIGDYVRVNKRPLGAPALSIDCFIEQIEHEFDGQTGDWITKVTVSPAIAEYWNLNTIQAITTGAPSAGNLVLTKSSLGTSRDIIAGQMLQWSDGSSTYVEVVSGAITETATTVTVPVTRVGVITQATNTVKYATLTSLVPMDYVYDGTDQGFGYLDNNNLDGFTKVVVNGELITCAPVYFNSLRPTVRAVNGTKQSVQGSSSQLGLSPAVMSHTASHLPQSVVYGVTASAGGNAPASVTVTEYLDNQIKQIPYQAFNYGTLGGASTLGSWTNTFYTGTKTTTTPASGIKYNSFVVNPIVDRTNYPSSDLVTGQIITLYNGTAAESFAITTVGAPDNNNLWTLTGYKITDSSRTLSAAIRIDGTTVTCSGAVTASAILIGNEFMQVTAGSGTTTLTVTRGTPDLAVWSVLSKSPHYQYDKIYTVVNAGLTNTYASGNALIEGYNVTTPIIGTTRLGY